MFKWLERQIDPFAPFDDERMPPHSVPRFSWHYLRPVRGWLVLIFFSNCLIGGLESGLFFLIGWFVDLLAKGTPREVWAEHGNLLLWAAFVVLFVRPVLHFLHEAVVNQAIVPQTTNMIRWRTHSYTLGHAVSYFQSDFAGRLANRITQVGPALRESAVEIIDRLWYVAIYAFTALGAFWTTSVWLALPTLGWIAGYTALIRYFVPRAQERSRLNAEKRSILVGRIVDSYTNILTVKLFARGAEERSAVREAVAAHTTSFLRSLRLITGVNAALQALNSAYLVATAAIAGWLWAQGEMTPGAIAAGLALALRLSTMSGWVMQVVRGVFENIGIIQESMETIARPHAIVDDPGAPDLVVRRGEVRFDDVVFHYGRDEGLLDRLNIVIAPGEKVGLVGPSGAGKTTITSLLLRLHDLEGGRILIDGQNIATVSQDSLRRQIAVVTQDTSLLHRSIRENIAYGRPTASRPRDRAGGAARPCRRLHRRPRGFPRTARLRRPCRRARRQALRRPAPARRHRPGDPEGRADPGPRRGHLGPRLGDRGGDPGGARDPDEGQDRHRHRAPALDHRRPRPPDRHRPRRHRRGGQPRRTVAAGRGLCPPVAAAVGRLSRRGGPAPPNRRDAEERPNGVLRSPATYSYIVSGRQQPEPFPSASTCRGRIGA